MVNLGDIFPNFTAATTDGDINFHDWKENSWAILFSHPADFTPVCTTELGKVASLIEEFNKRNVKPIALSIDTVQDHKDWTKDICTYNSLGRESLGFPIIADEKRDLAVKFGMLDPDEKDSAGMPLTCRAVFIISPDHRLKLSILYPATTGRNFDEILRVIDSLQLTAQKKVATPVNWKVGDEVMVVPSVAAADVPSLFPEGVTVHTVPSGKGYLRTTSNY